MCLCSIWLISTDENQRYLFKKQILTGRWILYQIYRCSSLRNVVWAWTSMMITNLTYMYNIYVGPQCKKLHFINKGFKKVTKVYSLFFWRTSYICYIGIFTWCRYSCSSSSSMTMCSFDTVTVNVAINISRRRGSVRDATGRDFNTFPHIHCSLFYFSTFPLTNDYVQGAKQLMVMITTDASG